MAREKWTLIEEGQRNVILKNRMAFHLPANQFAKRTVGGDGITHEELRSGCACTIWCRLETRDIAKALIAASAKTVVKDDKIPVSEESSEQCVERVLRRGFMQRAQSVGV
jgi:hypothetical protein